jgi:hypothetical protein
MASSATKGLAFGAALFGGLQAGVTANRGLRSATRVGTPRCHLLGKLHARGKRRRWSTFLPEVAARTPWRASI